MTNNLPKSLFEALAGERRAELERQESANQRVSNTASETTSDIATDSKPAPESKPLPTQLEDMIRELDDLGQQLVNLAPRFFSFKSAVKGKWHDLRWIGRLRILHPEYIWDEYTITFTTQGAWIETPAEEVWPEEFRGEWKELGYNVRPDDEIVNDWNLCVEYMTKGLVMRLAVPYAEAEFALLKLARTRETREEGVSEGREWALKGDDGHQSNLRTEFQGIGPQQFEWGNECAGIDLWQVLTGQRRLGIRNDVHDSFSERKVCEFWNVSSLWEVYLITPDFAEGFLEAALATLEDLDRSVKGSID